MKLFFVSPLILGLLTSCGDQQPASSLNGSQSSVIVRSDAGRNASDIQKAVDDFRDDLGGDNNLNTPGTQAEGHREINWDGVPAAQSAPNLFDGNFFQIRGLLVSTPSNKLQVSSSLAENDDVEFSNLNRAFDNLFATFSPEKLFTAVDSNILDITFTVPGSLQPATVTAFGAVFTDVDLNKVTSIEYFDQHHRSLGKATVKAVPGKNETLSFLGVKFKKKKIAKVRIKAGNAAISKWSKESKHKDLVVLDDFLYSEPQAIKRW